MSVTLPRKISTKYYYHKFSFPFKQNGQDQEELEVYFY